MEPFFLKVQKTLIFSKFYLHTEFYIKLHILSKKRLCGDWSFVDAELLKKISLIAVAVSEIICFGRTDPQTDGQEWFYKSHGWKPGTN